MYANKIFAIVERGKIDFYLFFSSAFYLVQLFAYVYDQLVRSLVVEPTHPGSSPRLGTGARIFLDLFQDFPALCVKW